MKEIAQRIFQQLKELEAKVEEAFHGKESPMVYAKEVAASRPLAPQLPPEYHEEKRRIGLQFQFEAALPDMPLPSPENHEIYIQARDAVQKSARHGAHVDYYDLLRSTFEDDAHYYRHMGQHKPGMKPDDDLCQRLDSLLKYEGRDKAAWRQLVAVARLHVAEKQLNEMYLAEDTTQEIKEKFSGTQLAKVVSEVAIDSQKRLRVLMRDILEYDGVEPRETHRLLAIMDNFTNPESYIDESNIFRPVFLHSGEAYRRLRDHPLNWSSLPNIRGQNSIFSINIANEVESVLRPVYSSQYIISGLVEEKKKQGVDLLERPPVNHSTRPRLDVSLQPLVRLPAKDKKQDRVEYIV